jgi:small subunit ribosomal protein S8e
MERVGLSVYQGRDWRSETGRRLKPFRKKRKYEMGRHPTHTKLEDEMEIVPIRTKGGNVKVRVYKTCYANVIDPETNKAQKVKILKVIENPADRNLDRMGVITKGTIIETELGKAKITSRPGQDGTVNAVLLKE